MKRNSKFLVASLAALILPLSGYLVWSWWWWKRPVTFEGLANPDTRLRTFYRAWREAEDSQHEIWDNFRSWSNFKRYHQSIDMLECPQGDGAPLYLLMRKTSFFVPVESPFSGSDKFRRPEVWKDWWAAKRTPAPAVRARPIRKPDLKRHDHFAIDLFDGTGKWIHRPFDGANISDGVFFDLDQDGFLERVDTVSYGGLNRDGLPDIRPYVLHVDRVKEKAEPLFSVVLNLEMPSDSAERQEFTTWDYQCLDSDRDGLIEIQLGPTRDGAASIDPKVIFGWDQERQTFVDRDPATGEKAGYLMTSESEGNTILDLHREGKILRHFRDLRSPAKPRSDAIGFKLKRRSCPRKKAVK